MKILTRRTALATARLAVASVVLGALASIPAAAALATTAQPGSAVVHETNLVSDIPGLAATTDPLLRNPWGIAASTGSPLWIADNGTGVSALYNGTGQPFPIGNPLVVSIPPASGLAGTPTGSVFNGTSDFLVSNGVTSRPSVLLFASLDGTISGWNAGVDPTHAIRVVDNSASRAIYTGLALGSTGSGDFLYAANFHAGTVDVFDRNFVPTTLPGSFEDPWLPTGFAPFGIANLDGKLYVTYAKQDADRTDDVAGPGNGFVDVFDTNGNLLRRVISGKPLNSPWGLTLAPSSWGRLAGDLMVGSNGDGTINLFDPVTGDRKGGLRDESHAQLTIPGLQGLQFGTGGNGGDTSTLFFTAGLNNYADGLFGSLTRVASTSG
jgi:uncharacterized protein (TIGR03118 family)